MSLKGQKPTCITITCAKTKTPTTIVAGLILMVFRTHICNAKISDSGIRFGINRVIKFVNLVIVLISIQYKYTFIRCIILKKSLILIGAYSILEEKFPRNAKCNYSFPGINLA
jgi:hypothetical protein